MMKLCFRTRSVCVLLILSPPIKFVPQLWSVVGRSTGVPFPKNFRDTVRTIFRRLFRVYGHIYSSHFDQICALGIEGLFSSLGLFYVLPRLTIQYSMLNELSHLSPPEYKLQAFLPFCPRGALPIPPAPSRLRILKCSSLTSSTRKN